MTCLRLAQCVLLSIIVMMMMMSMISIIVSTFVSIICEAMETGNYILRES